MSEFLTVGGGLAGIFAFVIAIFKIYSQDKVWRELIQEVRDQLSECHRREVELSTKVTALEGEVMILRRQIHADYWLGTQPSQRNQPPEGGEDEEQHGNPSP